MKCPICDIDYSIEYLELLKCKKCNHIFNKNIYDEKYWNDLYENNYTSNERKLNHERNEMYVQEIRWINKFKKLQGNFLDVGCSYGNFFQFLPNSLKKIGLDISTEVIEQARKINSKCKFFRVPLCEYDTTEKFDFIQFRGVIQHSTNSLDNLKCAVKLLKDDGIIIITTLPNFSSITSKLYKKQFRFYEPDICPNFFTDESFGYLIKNVGLKVVYQNSPYFHTPYENFSKDLISFFINKLKNKKNPPFYGVVKNYILIKN
jgi:SAM-dependent methyltransferase